MAGGNWEAALEVTSHGESTGIVRDAIEHLKDCRDTAELFNPGDMSRYEEIQARRRPKPPELEKEGLLIIHAEAATFPTTLPFMVHLRVVPTDFDRFFRLDTGVRLHLYVPGSLAAGRQVSPHMASAWKGSIAAVVRTGRHPNSGATASFAAVDYDLDVLDTVGPPRFAAKGGSAASDPKSQVVLRMDNVAAAGEEVYSLASRPVRNVLEGVEPGVPLHEVDTEMLRFFTPESREENHLLYRPLVRVKQLIAVTGYEETVRSSADEQLPLFYEVIEAGRPVDAFFFLTKYVIRGAAR
jgi:hypothetical protein